MKERARPLPANYRTVRQLLEIGGAQLDSAHSIARANGDARALEAKAAATFRQAADALDPETRETVLG